MIAALALLLAAGTAQPAKAPSEIVAEAPDALRYVTRLWVVEVNGRSVGLVQDYRIRDHPEFALLTPDPDALGVDYLIGEPAYVGRGIGTLMLWAWLVRVPRRFPDVRHCFAAPDHRNEASLRLLERVGFRRGTWFDEPQSDGSTATVVGATAFDSAMPVISAPSTLTPIAAVGVAAASAAGAAAWSIARPQRRCSSRASARMPASRPLTRSSGACSSASMAAVSRCG